MSILNSLTNTSDIKKLSIKELELLCEEIREIIIKTSLSNGGHLASNLGVVETTLALYYVFDLPTDKLIFDVGHQCYTHKILSGRLSDFSSLRKEDGISGFPDSDESPFDTLTSGHAGNAVAGGLGICFGRDANKEDYKVISFVGDASLTNGLSLEAMNSSEEKPDDFIVILNDNGMSIAKNENGLYKSIISSTTRRPYLAIKGGAKKLFGKSRFGRMLSKIKDFFKRLFNPHIYIDDMGFKYVGTIDGHNLKQLIKTFKQVKEYKRATFIHVSTVKGKGYPEAEKHADVYHGVSANSSITGETFSTVLGEKLCAVAESNDKVFAITAGMTSGVGLTEYSVRFPKRFVDVGISEEYAVTLASGMATAGLKPVVCIYSTFLQRAYDQIIHDVCIKNLPVVFCIDRAGVVGADGKTHQGVFDLSYLRHIPNMTVLCPKDGDELSKMLDYALSLNSPVAIRYPNGIIDGFSSHTDFKLDWEELNSSVDNKVAVLAVGGRAIKIAEELSNFGVNVDIYNARTVKPLDTAVLDKVKNKLIVTIEDNVLAGGFGSAVCEYYAQNNIKATVSPFGLKDEFIAHASVESQLFKSGLSAENISKKILDLLKV